MRDAGWIRVVAGVLIFALAGLSHAGDADGEGADPKPRDPHAYAEGRDFGPMRPHFADEATYASFWAEQFELQWNDGDRSGVWDVQAWYGYDYDRAVFKSEGAREGSDFREVRSELLWSHALAPFWDMQLGIRHDTGGGPRRNWLAFGVQGLAPYWFEVEATAYAGPGGRHAARLDLSYELLFTQRLILEPQLEMDYYTRSDPLRHVGQGLSEASVGLRLRYEFRREFAPYVGIEHARRFGATADLLRQAGDPVRETAVVAGLRFWF